jgi:hypothetical protein
VAAGEILAPSWCDVVVVGGATEPGGGTAVEADPDLPLYIDEGLRLIEPPNNRSNQVYFSFLPYALGVALV